MSTYELCVKARNQSIIILSVTGGTLVSEVRLKIAENSGVVVERQPDLFFQGVLLPDDKTLEQCGVVPDGCPGGPIVTMGWTRTDPFYVHVKFPDGTLFRAFVTCNSTVAQLRAQITKEAGVPYLMQKLYSDDMELNEFLTLEECNIEPNATLFLVFAKNYRP